MSSQPLFAHVTINIPRICKTMYMKVRHDERIFDLIYRVINSTGLKETNSYRLFGSSENFVQIPSEELCSCLFFTSYDTLYLLTKEPRVISVIYENRKSTIAFDNDAESSELVTHAIRCLGLPLDEMIFVLFDPIKNVVYPLDIPVQTDFLVLRPFTSITSQFLFNPSACNIEASSSSFHILTFSKQILSPLLKSLLLKIHTHIKRDKAETFTLCELSQTKVEEIFQNYSKEDILDDLSDEEDISLLFFILSMHRKSYIPIEIHKMIAAFMHSKNDTEKYNFLYVVISLIPLCSQCLIIELCNCFHLMYSNTDLIQILAKIIFPNSQNQKSEESFITFLLLFHQWVLRLPKSNKKLKLYHKKLVIIEDVNPKVGKSIRGDVQIENEDELKDFEFNPEIIPILEKLMCKKDDLKEDHDVAKFNEMNKKLEKMSKLNLKKKQLIAKLQEKLEK
ncbi:hypothetical protein TRFO_13769 [Tritrichomonas foetus]|uniref:Uncharacterized protein n=1 Tax=Tritrichomonas foetus TaxID=1144522 RepID=A0A1J4L1L2_9EUKA|nr:hypothetical protein TRFO_13769 [Tritrichomonas foetus]|eukprot:OHT15781.1 hypothetical protein TRFO_13769 [Tritrichomonas foetus]